MTKKMKKNSLGGGLDCMMWNRTFDSFNEDQQVKCVEVGSIDLTPK